MAEPCPVCRGSKIIRLPLYRDVSVMASSPDDEIRPSLEKSSRVYSCPECTAPSVPEDRVSVVQVGAQASMRVGMRGNDDYIAHLRHDLAHRLADEILRSNMIVCEEGQPSQQDKFNESVPIRATLGVVSPVHVASIQKRIDLALPPVLDKVLQRASESIHQWGSHYHAHNVGKDQAVDSVKRAIERTLAERKMKKL